MIRAGRSRSSFASEREEESIDAFAQCFGSTPRRRQTYLADCTRREFWDGRLKGVSACDLPWPSHPLNPGLMFLQSTVQK